jgi:GTP cyclohydrolase IB
MHNDSPGGSSAVISLSHMEFKSLPDIASQSQTFGSHTQNLTAISWVGMEKIQMPIRWKGQILSAEVRAQVNLVANTSRGIHMSRLYSLLSETFSINDLSWSALENLAQKFIESQGEISQAARVTVKFQLPLEKKALKSELKGWRIYPIEMDVIKTSVNR